MISIRVPTGREENSGNLFFLLKVRDYCESLMLYLVDDRESWSWYSPIFSLAERSRCLSQNIDFLYCFKVLNKLHYNTMALCQPVLTNQRLPFPSIISHKVSHMRVELQMFIHRRKR